MTPLTRQRRRRRGREEEEEEVEEEVSSNEMLMNQLDTSEEKLFVKHAHGMLFDDDGDTTLMSSVPHTPGSHERSNEESSDEDDNGDDF
jgi:hypothetical protein